MRSPAIGIVGWKNSGKTTLAVKLIAEFTRCGYRVATVKHAHHDADVDREGTDTFRHRAAGAAEVVLVTSRRWVLIHEGDDPPLVETLARLSPADVVIVEGYKQEFIPKIEVRRLAAAKNDPLAVGDIIAIAADHRVESKRLPTFDLNDIDRIADFIIAYLHIDRRVMDPRKTSDPQRLDEAG